VGCHRCERLVAWREGVVATGRAAYAGERYWERPLPGWGDPAARLVVVGLAPAAHGGNRTGRMFTGDRTGDFLFAALFRAGFANQPESVSAEDGLELTGAYVTAAVRCAPPDNRPAPGERDNCAPYLAVELDALKRARVLLALGAFALDALARQPSVAGAARRRGRRPKFAHGLELALGPAPGGGPARTLLCSYHPSQRNVFTGLLTPAMFDAVLARARELGA
jgi:uracil-DNA glycosylase family 4